MIGRGKEKGKGNSWIMSRRRESKKGTEKHHNIGMLGGRSGGKSRWRKERGEVGVVLS
jgi:hypothetical protein